MDSSNAIAWGHMQLRGGWRNLLLVSGAYLALIVGLIFVFVRIDPLSATSTLRGWTNALLVFQIGVLLIYGSYAIAAAIRKDVSSKIIESHRLMPVSGTEAVIGYMLGPGAQAISLGAVNLLVGLVIAPLAGLPILGWVKANFVLSVFVACYWMVVVFLTLAMPFGSRVFMALVWVVALGHQGIAPLMPGLAFVIGPALGMSVFNVISTSVVDVTFQYSMLAQLLMAVLCFVGAARKYRRDDVLSWGPLMALAVVAAYVGVSLIGLASWENIRPRTFRTERLPFEVQLLLCGIGAMWLATLPVCAVTWMHAEYRRRRALNDPAPNPRPVPIVLVTVVAAVIAAVVMPLAVRVRWYVCMQSGSFLGGKSAIAPVIGLPLPADIIVRTVVVFVAFLVTVSYLFRFMYGRGSRSAWGAMLLLILVMWVGPVVGDFILSLVLNGPDSNKLLSALSTCSPPMALYCLWTHSGPENLNIGIAVQCVVAGLLVVIYHATRPRAHAIPVAIPVSR